MSEKVEDLSLPTAVITRLIKEAIPEGVLVSKEARAAIGKAASVFILYATSCANNHAVKAKRKTLTGGDVLTAMEDMEFGQFIPALQEALEAFKKEQKEKAERKKKAAAAAASAVATATPSEAQQSSAQSSEISKMDTDLIAPALETDKGDTAPVAPPVTTSNENDVAMST
eukprot:m.9285 g.9285  ORF g.9285 m.9285 type:complete len:171 (+) comp21241_c0_seq1:348-860(+)